MAASRRVEIKFRLKEDEMIDKIKDYEGLKAQILSPIAREEKGTFENVAGAKTGGLNDFSGEKVEFEINKTLTILK